MLMCIFFSIVGVLNKSSISLLVEIALRLAKDGEKVKIALSNWLTFIFACLSAPMPRLTFSHKECRYNWRYNTHCEKHNENKASCIFAMKRVVLILILIFIQVKSNAVRALGYLSRFIRFNHQADTINDPRLRNILCPSITILFCWLLQLTIFWILVTVIQFFVEILCGLKEWYRLWCLVWQLGMWRYYKKLFYLKVWNWNAECIFVLLTTNFRDTFLSQ